jgi:hypothetical protein
MFIVSSELYYCGNFLGLGVHSLYYAKSTKSLLTIKKSSAVVLQFD